MVMLLLFRFFDSSVKFMIPFKLDQLIIHWHVNVSTLEDIVQCVIRCAMHYFVSSIHYSVFTMEKSFFAIKVCIYNVQYVLHPVAQFILHRHLIIVVYGRVDATNVFKFKFVESILCDEVNRCCCCGLFSHFLLSFSTFHVTIWLRVVENLFVVRPVGKISTKTYYST